MAVNKVEINGEVKLDLTQDTVTENTLLQGVTAHDAAGVPVIGKAKAAPSSPYMEAEYTTETVDNGDGTSYTVHVLSRAKLYNHTRISTGEFYAKAGLQQLDMSDPSNNITVIEANALSNARLENVVFPSTITEIQSSAFSNAIIIGTLQIPQGVKKIPEYAFYYVNNFYINGNLLSPASISLPSGLTEIGTQAFAGTNVESLILPDSVASIGNSAFSGARIKSFSIPASLTKISDNMLGSSLLESCTIPNTVTEIGSLAFYSTQLTELTIPSSVTTMGNQVCYHCTNLASLTINAAVSKIEDNFAGECALTALTLPSTLTEIGANAFYQNKLTSVVIPAGVTSIGDSAFKENEITSLTLPTGLTTIGSEAFSTNQLTSVVIPSGVTIIESFAFNANQISSLELPQTLEEIWDYAFNISSLTSLVIPNSVTYIGSNAFYNTPLTSLTLNSGLQEIGDEAFKYHRLSSLTIPASVSYLGDSAFEGDTRNQTLTTVTFETGSQLEEIPSECFNNNPIQFLTLPSENLTSIGGAAFLNNHIETLEIPASVQQINIRAFYQDPDTSSPLTSLTLHEGLQYVAVNAFYGNKLTALTLPSTLNAVEDYAFSGAELTSLTIPANMQYIGVGAFMPLNAYGRSATPLQTLTFLGEYPPYMDMGCFNIGPNTQIIVPSASIEAYKAAYPLSVFADQIRGPLSDTFADNDWTTIIAACQSGSVPNTWVVGNSKTMTINGTDYQIDIIGKSHDDYADGSGKAPLTFQMHNCYNTTYNMNTGDTNSGGWKACAMRTTHLPAILALMPAAVQSAIREVSKKTSVGGMSSTIETTAEKLFLLSELEAYGGVPSSIYGEGTYYDYYKSGNSNVKYLNSNAKIWWLRSPYKSNSTHFCTILANGNPGLDYANANNGVAFAFCF